jgi:hypothetical protein
MSIQVQKTPNPNARKFVLPEKCFIQPLNVANAEAAAHDLLAARLFALDGVYNVFMVQDFVTINKLPDVPWEPLEAKVKVILAEFLLDRQNSTT